jgi:hypothetical protein
VARERLVANMPEFAKAFSCKPGAPLNPEKRCSRLVS